MHLLPQYLAKLCIWAVVSDRWHNKQVNGKPVDSIQCHYWQEILSRGGSILNYSPAKPPQTHSQNCSGNTGLIKGYCGVEKSNYLKTEKNTWKEKEEKCILRKTDEERKIIAPDYWKISHTTSAHPVNHRGENLRRPSDLIKQAPAERVIMMTRVE